MRTSAHLCAFVLTFPHFLDTRSAVMTRARRNKISVLLEGEEYERFEHYCKARGHKKSTLIARLIREHLAGERFELQRALPIRESREA